MDNKSQWKWFHWKERFHKNCDLKNVEMETSRKVDTPAGSFSYQFNLNLCLTKKDVSSRGSHQFYQMNLVWDLVSTSVPLRQHVLILKLRNCAIKISVDSADGQDHFSKWLHLDTSGDEKTCSWKAFIPQAKWEQLYRNKEKQLRSLSMEVVVFGSMFMTAIHNITCKSLEIPDNEAFDHGSVFQTKSIPYVRSGFDSEASTVILAVEQMPEEMVVANKFLLAAHSPVFRKMLFETDMAEKASGRVILKDTSFLALKMFIGLIRGDKVTGRDIQEMSTDDILHVLCLVHKYQVEGGIIDFCVMILMAKADSEFEIEDARRLFQIGKLLEIPDLCTRSFDWIRLCSVDSTKWDEIVGIPAKRRK